MTAKTSGMRTFDIDRAGYRDIVQGLEDLEDRYNALATLAKLARVTNAPSNEPTLDYLYHRAASARVTRLYLERATIHAKPRNRPSLV